MKNLTPGCYCIHEWKRRKDESQTRAYSPGMQRLRDAERARTAYVSSLLQGVGAIEPRPSSPQPESPKNPWWRFWK